MYQTINNFVIVIIFNNFELLKKLKYRINDY